ncbi:MAG: hypothetical protein M3R24_35760 [Chloroflexota bacterium]|nr:hypothetical protein [Chloroflexota bacterium]
MDGKTLTGGIQGMPRGEMGRTPTRIGRQQLDRGVDQLLAVIDQAIVGLKSDEERAFVRASVVDAISDAIDHLASQVPAQPRLNPMAVGDTANAAMGVARQVQNLGFVEFTTGLINGTFDAIVGATIKQMDAYAKLVADISKSLVQFRAENVSDAQLNAHLAERYPDGSGGTVVRTGYTFTDTAEDTQNGVQAKTGAEKLLEVADALIAETRTLRDEQQRLTREGLGITDGATEFTSEQVTAIRAAIALTLANDILEHLRAMAREGMARIVVTNGEILSKLTFRVASTEQQQQTQNKYHQDSAGAYIRGRAGWLWGSVSAGASWNQLNVNTVNEQSFDTVTMSTEIIGQVRIQFKTETFPPATFEGGA